MSNEIHVSSMVSQLVDDDISVKEIAADVGVAQSTITRIKARSVDPRYSHFVKIRSLWVKHFNNESISIDQNCSV